MHYLQVTVKAIQLLLQLTHLATELYSFLKHCLFLYLML